MIKYLIYTTIYLCSCFACNAQISRELHHSISFSADTVFVSLHNSGTDTLYLFDSYLEQNTEYDFYGREPFWTSEYLHRYHSGTEEYKLSFLPIISYLSVRYRDVITQDKSRIIRRGILLYGFKEILPKESTIVQIPRIAFAQRYYVEDIPIREYGKNDDIRFKKIMVNEPSRISIELAIYRDIRLLKDRDAYYFQENEFDTQAKSFEVLSIPMELSSFKNH